MKSRTVCRCVLTAAAAFVLSFFAYRSDYSFIPLGIRAASLFSYSEKVSLLRAFILFLCLFFAGLHLIIPIDDLYGSLYRHRYLIGLGIVAFCVIFNLNGSSIAQWSTVTAGSGDSGTILGTSRAVRSDEWAVFSPMIFSQSAGGSVAYSWFSRILRGDVTDVFMVYALPVRVLWIIYRPFLAGFLLLGNDRGLAFFWSARLVSLWLVSFELCMLVTERKKRLSFVGAMMISLAPVVQWWFAINGLVEMLVFGSLFILMVHRFLTAESRRGRWVTLPVMIVCAGGYVLTLYPSWMVPLAYCFLALLIWVILNDAPGSQADRTDFWGLFGAAVLFALSMAFIFSRSSDTIRTVMNTAYPGKRLETGGGEGWRFFSYPVNILFPLKTDSAVNQSNVCEMSCFYDLFPLGLILSLYLIFKRRVRDRLLTVLLAFLAFLSAWCVIGFPVWLAKLTLLSYSQASRSFIAVGLLNLLLLLRAVSLMKEPLHPAAAVLGSSAGTAVLTAVAKKVYGTYLTGRSAVFVAAFLFCTLLLFLLWGRTLRLRRSLAAEIVCLMLACGALVNPIQNGTGGLFNTRLAEDIQGIAASDSGLWVVDYSGTFVLNNYPVMMGAPTVNSTNVYPDLARWGILDESGEYREIYNRYAHINIVLTGGKSAVPQFSLLQADLFEVSLSNRDLVRLQIKYVLTGRDLTALSGDGVNFRRICSDNGYSVYEVILSS